MPSSGKLFLCKKSFVILVICIIDKAYSILFFDAKIGWQFDVLPYINFIVEHHIAKIFTQFVYKMITYDIISRGEYSLVNWLPLIDALAKVAAVQNLFFLFES